MCLADDSLGHSSFLRTVDTYTIRTNFQVQKALRQSGMEMRENGKRSSLPKFWLSCAPKTILLLVTTDLEWNC